MISAPLNHVRYFLFQCGLGFKKLAVYRVNYWIIVLFETLDCFAFMLLIEVVYANIPDLAGWTKYEWYVLMGTYAIQGQLYSALTIAGIDSISSKISSGNLDFLLIKPLSTPYLALFAGMSFHKFYPLPVPVYMVIYGCSKLGIAADPGLVCSYLLFLITGIILFLNLTSALMALSFWFVRVRSFFSIMGIFHQYSQYPKEVFNKPLSLIFMFIIPVILLANPAALFLLNRERFAVCIAVFVMLAVTWLASKTLWHFGLKKYQSASS